MKACNIIWDAEPDVIDTLPTEVEIPNGITDVDDVSNYLSDLTGYCHFGFCLDPETGEV